MIHRIQRLETHFNRSNPIPHGPPRQLQTVHDIIDLLQVQVEAVRAAMGIDTVEKAKTIGYLAGVALKAIQTGTLATRMEALEAVLKQRKGEGKR
jgi:hypothetical protein